MILNEDFSDFDLPKNFIHRGTKEVRDADGFMTEYHWYCYPEEDVHYFYFGDPMYGYEDWTAESEETAKEWFDNYKGFEDADEYADYTEEEMRKMGAFDNLNDTEELTEIFGFGKKKYNHYIAAMMRDKSFRLFTYELGQAFRDAIEDNGGFSIINSKKNHFTTPYLRQYEFDATEKDFQKIEAAVRKIVANPERYISGDDIMDYKGRVNQDVKDALYDMFQFDCLEYNVDVNESLTPKNKKHLYEDELTSVEDSDTDDSSQAPPEEYDFKDL